MSVIRVVSFVSCRAVSRAVSCRSIKSASLKVRSKQDNAAGAKLPHFELFHASDGSTAALARDDQKIQTCRATHLKAIELLIDLASLQTSFFTLDEAIKTINRQPQGQCFVQLLTRMRVLMRLSARILQSNVDYVDCFVIEAEVLTLTHGFPKLYLSHQCNVCK
ncbi:hypothetical protein LUZ63_019651 [Rhynchospora breviuscula]|uniref:Uncharacterized protein n=1 Tax=Rhynchospora breviuscula TaxID=2022672 RepID=A0A9Q0C6N0_9POAL|nr:hypothetical protein LUZ63_019651 [Rhynchospora breviuscula]